MTTLPTRTDYLAEAIAETGSGAQRLDNAQARTLVSRVHDRFGLDLEYLFFWDTFTGDPNAIVRTHGWTLIGDYVGDAGCFLIVSEAESAWQFASGSDLVAVLHETPRFEFSVCDSEASYLICFNHHNALIGWGAARNWVARQPKL